MRRLRYLLLACVLAMGACGASGGAGASGAAASRGRSLQRLSAIGGPARAQAALLDWREFGLNPQRSDATGASPGIDAALLGHLRERTIALPGTVDSSPLLLHDAVVAGRSLAAIFVTTTYGKTVAVDAESGRILWTFTPADYARYAGSAQITTATPLIGPSGSYIYTASPDGRIHKLRISDGSEVRSGSWPVAVTLDPTHEKIASALGAAGPYLIVTTGGYYGDAPPYQGHVVLIERASGRIRAVFNTLCSSRRRLIAPASCSASDSAIWSRAGAVVEEGGTRLLVATGNGPWNGRSDFGDSALELSLPTLSLRQAFTPVDQAALDSGDLDLGSGGPALLGHGEALIGGKDGKLRVLSLAALDGHPPGAPERLGGEVQQLQTPGGDQLITEPCVWRHGAQTTVFVADASATAAYALRAGRLHRLWENAAPGSSPIFAGGLLYVYDPAGGDINVYAPSSPRPLRKLAGEPGHWNSPIVADGYLVEPTGDANDHRLHGALEIYSLR
ncbi:MAG TPA: PQQ-binding-like beta-propeller repeat protein [Solirubrobacteraceae bacterium]|nr:PQQ-binding-like beta-propeller repeat protein [Solirubrobacteraceae bacterium]